MCFTAYGQQESQLIGSARAVAVEAAPAAAERATAGRDAAVFFCGDGLCESFLGETAETCPEDCGYDPLIADVTFGAAPYEPLPSHGDFWLSTWADDGTPGGRLYAVWGDGCGAGVAWGDPGCTEWDWNTEITDFGMVALSGSPPNLSCVWSPPGCVRYRNIPDGISGPPHTQYDSKPSGILAIDNTLYVAGMSPQWHAVTGFLASSTDWGASWTMGNGTPWHEAAPHSAASPFRALMFINMGFNYQANTDGYVYGLGFGWGWDWGVITDGGVFLARAPVDAVADYGAYEYFTGLSGSEPQWSALESEARPVPGLITHTCGSAMYHEGLGRFLFLTLIGLFEAEHPWGPWTMVKPLLWWGNIPAWRDAAMPGLITKNAGPASVYFATSGLTDKIGYNLHLGRMDFSLRAPAVSVSGDAAPAGSRRAVAGPSATPSAARILLTPTPGPVCNQEIQLSPSGPMSIQEAIASVCPGGKIILADGIYSGEHNRNLDFGGKSFILQSEHGAAGCIIDCQRVGRAFYFHSGEGADAVVRGVTVRNGFIRSSGGGLTCLYSSPIIEACVFSACSSTFFGGAIMCYQSNAVIRSCTVENCKAGFPGGGIACMDLSETAIVDCTVVGNETLWDGGGIYNELASTDIVNCSITDNAAYRGGGVTLLLSCRVRLQNCFIERNAAQTKAGGMHVYTVPFGQCTDIGLDMQYCTVRDNFVSGIEGDNYGGAVCIETAYHAAISDSIFWGDYAQHGEELALFGWNQSLGGFGDVTFTHCDIAGGSSAVYAQGTWNLQWGAGMLNADPQFVDEPGYRSFLSQVSAGQASNSPCLDAGSQLAANVCFQPAHIGENYCLTSFTTRTDWYNDQYQADLGAHHPARAFVPAFSVGGMAVALVAAGIVMGWVRWKRRRRRLNTGTPSRTAAGA